MWAGYRDLVVSAPAEFVRLGIDAPDGWALIDHKSSANIASYAHTPATLYDDGQANLYAYATCLDQGIQSLPARWVYYETKKVRRAAPVDTTISLEVAGQHVEEASGRARELDTIRDERDAPCNPLACGEYGGCSFHKTAGGPCDAQRSFGALIQARVKKDSNKMGLPAAVTNRFAALQTGAVAPSPDAPAAPDATPPPAAPAPAKRGRGRPARAVAAAPDVGGPVDAPPDPGEAPPASGVMHKRITVPGEHGPITIEGDARDVCDVFALLSHG
jgi:hypothetical protein